MKKRKYECDCCGDEVYSLKERKNDETREPLLACEVCWNYSDTFWYYTEKGFFPPYKGLVAGDKVWCKILYDDDSEEWFKGIILNTTRINASGRYMYLYDCAIDGGELDGRDLFWEDEVWFRDINDSDDLKDLDLIKEMEQIVLNEKLLTSRHVDSIY